MSPLLHASIEQEAFFASDTDWFSGRNHLWPVPAEGCTGDRSWAKRKAPTSTIPMHIAGVEDAGQLSRGAQVHTYDVGHLDLRSRSPRSSVRTLCLLARGAELIPPSRATKTP